MNAFGQAAAQSPAAPRASLGSVVGRILLHGVFLLIAVGCFAAYLHFKVGGRSDAALASLVAAAGFGFAPVRDVVRLVFRVEGKALHLVHGLGGQNHPRNAKQAAAMQSFAASLPEVAQFAGGNLSSPANAQRAVVALSDILAKAQALGQTELDADPGFQSALNQVSTRFGAN